MEKKPPNANSILLKGKWTIELKINLISPSWKSFGWLYSRSISEIFGYFDWLEFISSSKTIELNQFRHMCYCSRTCIKIRRLKSKPAWIVHIKSIVCLIVDFFIYLSYIYIWKEEKNYSKALQDFLLEKLMQQTYALWMVCMTIVVEWLIFSIYYDS